MLPDPVEEPRSTNRKDRLEARTDARAGLARAPTRWLAALFATGIWLAAVSPARADEAHPDHAVFGTLEDENAGVSTSGLTDRYYVNGLKLSYTGGEGDLPVFLQDWGRALLGAGARRISVSIEQLMYTPDHSLAPIPAGDEPYAGELLASFGLLQDHEQTRTLIMAQVGVVGPASGAEQLQNGFHGLIGMGSNPWCCREIHDEPAGELTGERIWRAPLSSPFGVLETDVLPSVTVGLGNVRDYALAGALFRIGQGLQTDFGVPRAGPGMNGGDAFTPVRRLSGYLFGGLDGQVVAHDITLDGNTFGASPHVSRSWLVGDFEVGAAVMFANWRLSYTQSFETKTFSGQQGGLHQMGALALTGRF